MAAYADAMAKSVPSFLRVCSLSFTGCAKHDLADDASCSEQLVRLSGFRKSKSLRNQGLDLLLVQEVEQGQQILSEPGRFQPFEPLDAVGDHTFSARKQPAAGNIQPENGNFTKAMTTP